MSQPHDNIKSVHNDAPTDGGKDGHDVQIPGQLDNLKFWKWTLILAGTYSAFFTIVGMTIACIAMSWLLDGKFNLFHWLAAGPGFKIENASPGVTLAVVAGIILYITRFDVAISNVGMIRALLQPREAVSDPKADPKQGTDSRTIEIPVPVDHPQFWLGAVIAEFVESMLKGIFGTVFIFAGIHLISQGLDVNQTSWVAEFLGFRFSDLGPGTVLTVVGTGFIWKSKFDVAAKNVALGRNQLTAPVARKQPA